MRALVAAALLAGAAALVIPGRFRRTIARGNRLADGSEGVRRSFSVIESICRSVATRFRRRKSQNEWRIAAAELVAAFASELRAGQPVRQAFARAQRSSPLPLASRAVAVAELGGDVPRALRAEAARQSLPILQSLAALWRVAEGSGAGLAQAADRLAVAETAAQQARAEVTAQLASPRATAKVLAGLPIVGVIMGSGLGASPVEWLVGSPWGLMVMTAGVGLEVLGLWWISRLTNGVERLM